MILKSILKIFLFSFFMYLSFRLPGRFLFDSLNIMWIYPVFNAIISCLTLVMVYGMKDQNLKRVKIATVGLCSLVTGIIILYIGHYWESLRYAYEYLITFLPFTMAILSENKDIILTLHKNGPSNAPAPAAGSGSGSGAAGSGSGAAGSGSGSGAAGSVPRLPGFAQFLAGV